MAKKKNTPKAPKKEAIKRKKLQEKNHTLIGNCLQFILGILVTVLYYNLPNARRIRRQQYSRGYPNTVFNNDDTCILRNDSWITTSLGEEFNYSLERIDSKSAKGKQIISSMGITTLPAVLFSKNFINSTGYESLGNYVKESGDYYILLMQGIKNLSAVESPTPRIDLFVMSQCAYGTPAQQNMINLKKAVPGLELNMHYIVDSLTESEMNTYVSQYKASYDSLLNI